MMDLDPWAGRVWERPGLGAYRFHEELKPRQPLVKLAKRLAVPVVVQPDTFEQRRVEVLERAEVITVSGRDLGDQRPRFARPRGEAPEPHVQRRERQHHPFLAQCRASVTKLA